MSATTATVTVTCLSCAAGQYLTTAQATARPMMSTRPDVPAPLMSATTVFLFTVTRTARQSTAVLEYDYDHENAKNESAVIYEQTAAAAAARFGPLYTTENTVACICVQIYSCLQKRRLPPGAGFSESRRPPGGRLKTLSRRRTLRPSRSMRRC